MELIIKGDASRSTIHDEVSTILRANKCKDITVQMTSLGAPVFVPIEESTITRRIEARTEDDLNSITDS